MLSADRSLRSVIVLSMLVFAGCTLSPTDSPSPTPTPVLTWEYVGSPAFSDGQVLTSTIAIDNGLIYVGYCDDFNSFKAVVKKFNGISWDTIGTPGFTPAISNLDPQIAFVVYNGVPYLTYSGSTDLYTYNASSWTTLGTAPFSGAGGRYLSIDAGSIYVAHGTTVSKWNGSSWDSIGTPEMNIKDFYIYSHQLYIAGQDTSVANTGYNVKLFSGTTSWDNVAQPGFSGAAPFNNAVSLYVGNNGPMIAYADSSSGNQLFCKALNQGAWVVSGTNPISTYLSYYPKLTFYGISALIVFQESSFDYGGDGSYPDFLRMANGTAWDVVGGSSLSEGGGAFPSLAILNNTAYVSYRDELNAVNKLSVRKIQLN